MVLQLAFELRPAGQPHRERKPRTGVIVDGQLVRLLVVPFLQAVLDAPQEAIGREQFGHGVGRQQFLPGQLRQRLEQAARLQSLRAAATQQLERLDDELDLADAAGAELHVLLQFAAFDLARDQFLHRAQRFEHAEVEVAAIHERAQRVAVEVAEAGLCPVNGTRLHVGVALPVAPVLLQVLLHRVETHGHGARVAERSQPQVDAINEAVVRGRAEQLRDALARAHEILFVLQRPRTRRLAVLGEEKHEIDVR